MNYLYPGLPQVTAQIGRRAHPDVLANRIAQEVLASVVSQDPNARADINVTVGEFISLDAKIRSTSPPQKKEIAELARETVRKVGYTEEWGYDPSSKDIIIGGNGQSANIDHAVSNGGAGDTITKIGFATFETSHGLPLPTVLARVIKSQLDLRYTSSTIPYLGPDGKINVGVWYENGEPKYATFVVVAAQHSKGLSEQQLEKFKSSIKDEVVIPDLGEWYDHKKTRIIVNGARLFDHGGPSVDTGVKGKKDHDHSYGDFIGTIGGSAYGKDGSKLDLQGHILTRNIALSIVKSELAKVVKVTITYPIGGKQPIQLSFDMMGTGTVADSELEAIVRENFPLEPVEIIKRFDLSNPQNFLRTADHFFGSSSFRWEHPVILNHH